MDDETVQILITIKGVKKAHSVDIEVPVRDLLELTEGQFHQRYLLTAFGQLRTAVELWK